MNLYIFGTDRNIFSEDSYIFKRSLDYSKKVDSLHIIVFSLKRNFLTQKQIGNLHIYPTNSYIKIFYFIDAFITFYKIYKKNSSAVLSSQDPFEIGLFSVFISKLFSIPLQIQIHTNLFDSNFRKSFINKIRFHISKLSLRFSKRIRVVSVDIKNKLISDFGISNPIDVLPISIDLYSIDNTLPLDLVSLYGDFKFILVASRLTVEKKVDSIIKSFAILLSNFKNAKLIICGDGDQRKYLEKLTIQLNIDKNVVFVGWQKNVFSYMKSSDLFISTSDFEGYGMSLVEAVFCLCPVISTNTGISSLFLKDGISCFFVQNSDFNYISDKMYNILRDDKLASSLSKNALTALNTFYNKGDYTDQYINLLKKCID